MSDKKILSLIVSANEGAFADGIDGLSDKKYNIERIRGKYPYEKLVGNETFLTKFLEEYTKGWKLRSKSIQLDLKNHGYINPEGVCDIIYKELHEKLKEDLLILTSKFSKQIFFRQAKLIVADNLETYSKE